MRPTDPWEAATWAGARRAQIRRALELTVRERLEVLEALAETSARLVELGREAREKDARPSGRSENHSDSTGRQALHGPTSSPYCFAITRGAIGAVRPPGLSFVSPPEAHANPGGTMAEISVTAAGDDVYEVTVREPDGRTEHRVTMTADDVAWLDVEAAPTLILEESFRFLLAREPKEAILARFDLRTIARYFPDYRGAMRRRFEE